MPKYSDGSYSPASTLGGTEYWACVQGGATRIVSADQIKTFMGLGTGAALAADTDVTLAANSDTKVATQKAIKAYVDNIVQGLLDLKGGTDCSANPNYPAALKGDTYKVTVAGKIGGGSGKDVDVGDVFIASADNAGGTEASVGTSWFVLEHNLSGAASSGAITGSGLTMATARLLGRTTASTGAIEEISAGTGLTLATGALSVDQTALKPTESLIVAAGDETTAITSGTSKITFRMPYAFTVTAVRASLTTAQTSGSIFTVDINEGGTTILSTKLTVDNTEKTSTTAATAAVISDGSLADDAEITIDVDQVGDGTAKGLKVVLIGHRT